MNKGLSTAVTLFCVVVFIHGCNQSKNTVVQSQDQRNWLGADEEAISSAQELDAPRILPKTYFAAALLFEQNGQWLKAVDQFQKAVTVNHQYVEAYAHMGMLLGKLGRHTEAEIALRRAVQLKPDSARMRNNLGYEYALQNRWNDAQAELNNAIRLQPDFARAYVNLGMVLGKQLRFEEALESFNVALPEADAYYNLAMMFRSDRRYRDAADALRHVLALNPTFPAAARLLEEIEPNIQPLEEPNPFIVANVDRERPQNIDADLIDDQATTLDPGEQDLDMSLAETILTSNQQPAIDSIDTFLTQSVDVSMPTDEISMPDTDVHQPLTDPIVPQVIALDDDETIDPAAPTPIVQPIVDDDAVPLAIAEPTYDRPIEATVIDTDVTPNDITPIVEATETWTHDPTFELPQDAPGSAVAQQIDKPQTAEVTTLVADQGPPSYFDQGPFIQETPADPIVEPAADSFITQHIDDATPIDDITGPLFGEPILVEVTPIQPADIPLPIQQVESAQVLADQTPIESFIDDDIIDWILADASDDAPCPDEVPDSDITAPVSPVVQDLPGPLAMDRPVGFPLWRSFCEPAPEQAPAIRPQVQPDGVATTIAAESPIQAAPTTQIPSPNAEPITDPATENTIEEMPTEEVFIWTISDATPDADTASSGTLAPPTRDDGPVPFGLQDANIWHLAQQAADWIAEHQTVAEQAPDLPDQDPTHTLAGADMPAETFIDWPTAIIPQNDDFDSQIGVDGVLSIADLIRIATANLVVVEPGADHRYDIDPYAIDLTASETVLLDSTAPADPDIAEPCPEFGLDLAAWETRLAGTDVFGWANRFDIYALPPSMAWFPQQLPPVGGDTFPMPDPSISIEPGDADLPPYFQGHPNCDVDGLMLFPYANSLPRLPR